MGFGIVGDESGKMRCCAGLKSEGLSDTLKIRVNGPGVEREWWLKCKNLLICS